MHVKVLPRCLRETTVVVRHKLSSKGVGSVRRTNARQPELLDQPVLKREMRMFHAPLGKTVVGADTGDVQLVRRAPGLRLAVAAGRSFIVDAEHAGLVVVKRQRLAVKLGIDARGLKIGESRLVADEMKLHQAASRIIHVNQQRAGLAAFLKPGIV